MRKFVSVLWHTPRSLAIRAINFYQATLSPDHGPLKSLHPFGYCPHTPTCSDYGKQVITQRGLIIGGMLTFRRILTCHPWTKPHPDRIRNAVRKASQEDDPSLS